ncbi:MAG TPA: tetratricopeptide repeat protein [Streptosporangiaceae bacterium]|nr:tetratricopeptide repeat protein [Streptosporangiaceae bacterium]
MLVHDGETPVDVPRGRLRVLLAALLLNTGNPVAADALAEVMWDGASPAGAVVTLRSHVLRLRRVLGPRAGARLVTRHPGYLLQAGEHEVDLLRFRGLCRDGRAALREGAWARAEGLLSEALGLWRGNPLADVSSELLLRKEVPGLEELRLQAEEWRADAALHLGRHDELVAGLQALAAQHPLRERFHAQLMLAFYRCGCQAEALAAYQEARQVLIDELGTEPGPELRQLHQQVLCADPALAAPEPAPAPRAHATVPCELPARVASFTGRSGELLALTKLIGEPGAETPGTVVISAIGGTAGVGKTALAVYWAHQVIDRFPDGQLYVNLRGYAPGQPMAPGDALARLLRSLGVPGRDIPAEQDERAARYRSTLAGKRILLILDNARSVEQVRPLLPGSPSCTVVVTSRDALPGLVARDGATRLDLDLLPLEDAVGLLRALIGAAVDRDPDAAARLALQCCRLPLALRVAAERAASRPAVPLAELTAELADQQYRLDLLDSGGDSCTAVRSVFSWSCRNLDAGTVRTFCLLSMHPGPDFEPYAAAALTNCSPGQARRAIDVLSRAYLVQPAGKGRYTMHDLLRAYARELAAGLSSEQERHAALTRLFDHYLQAAAAMTGTMFPAEHCQPAGTLPPPVSVPAATDPAEARAYLDSERLNLTAVVAHAAEHGWPGHATRLAATLNPYLEIEYVFEALTVHGHALRAARATGDRSAEAEALASIGGLDFWQGRQQEAVSGLQRALALFREVGNRRGEARVLGDLGIVGLQQGCYPDAVRHLQQALVLHRQAGNRSAEARVLSNLGRAAQRLGDYPGATARYSQALVMSRETGDRVGEAYTLMRLSVIDLQEVRYQQAAVRLQQALALFRVTRHCAGEAETLSSLGQVSLRQGRHRQAADYFQQALTLFRKMGDLADEAEALNGLGEVMLARGHPGQARTSFGRALDLARQAEVPYDQACAHNGLGRAYHTAGDHERARHHWQHALALFGELEAPEAEQVRRQLAACDPGAGESVPGPGQRRGPDQQAPSAGG